MSTAEADAPTSSRYIVSPLDNAAKRPRTKFFDLFKPLPKQLEFLKLSRTCRYMLYGGARGGGKSALLRWGLVWLLLEWHQRHGLKDVRVGLFCEDYPTLKDRQITKIKKEMPHWLGTLKETQMEGLGFFLRPEYGGGAIMLRNLDDPSKYQSAEFAAVAVEELTKNTVDVFNVLRGSLRWPGIENPQFWGATNPGGPGHSFCKAYWIDRDYPPELEPLAHLFGFVQSLPTDNPYLPDSYWEELNSLPTQLRKAWVEGLWDAFVGQAFDEWRDGLHANLQTARNLKNLPDGWYAAGAMDWGYDRPGWFGLNYIGPEDRMHIRWEFYFGRGTKNGPMTPDEVGRRIGIGLRGLPVPPIIVMDSAAFGEDFQGTPRKSEASEIQRGITEMFNNDLFKAPTLVKSIKGPGSRALRKTLLHSLLKWEPGPNPMAPFEGMQRHQFPKLTVDPEDAPEFMRTIPILHVEDDDPTKVSKEAEDHPFDGQTYLITHLRRMLLEDIDAPEETPEGRDPGITAEGKRKKKRPEPQTEQALSLDEDSGVDMAEEAGWDSLI